MGRNLEQNKRFFFEAAAAALLAVLFYHPMLNPGTMMSGGDGANLFWPIKVLIQHAVFGDGVLPLWNPYAYMGTPLAASLQHAVYYPPGWLMYLLPPAHFGIKLGNAFHLAFAGMGCWAWLRIGFRLGGWTSVFLGAAFPCVSWFWGHQDHINQIATISYLPLIALVNWLYLRERMRPLVFVAAYSGLAAFQFLAGHPQEAFYTHLFCFLLFAAVYVRRVKRPPFLQAIFAYTGAAVIAALLVAVQLLPMMELKSYSRRQFDDPSYPLSRSMPPDILTTYLAPHWFGSFRDGYFVEDETGAAVVDEAGKPVWDRRAHGEYGLFAGVPVLLLFFAAPWLNRKRRLVYTFLFMVIVFSLLLAMGGNTDPRRIVTGDFTEFPARGFSLYDLFLLIVPPASGFRVPARIAILASFCLITGAAIGCDGLIRILKNHRHQPFAAAAIGIAVLVALYLPSRRERMHYLVGVPELLSYKAEIQPKPSPLGRLYRLTNTDAEELVKTRHLETLRAGGNPLVFRYLSLQPHMNAVEGVYLVDGYEEGLIPTARFKDFIFEFNRNLRQFTPDADLMALLGVESVYTDLPVNPDAFPVEGQSEIGWRWHRNPRFRSAAFWLDAVEGIQLSRLDGPLHRAGEPHRGYNKDAIDYGGMPRWDDDWLPLSVEYESLNTIRIDVAHQPEGRSLNGSVEALLSLGWFPGWHFEPPAEVRAAREEVAFANAIHARLPVDRWTARELVGFGNGPQAYWRIHYQPFSHRLGLFLSALALAIWTALAGFLLSTRANPS